MPWHTLNCGDPTLCDGTLQDILKTYDGINRTSGLPAGAAIFSRHESRGSLHCELILYFTPEASPVAKAVGAVACNQPISHGLSPINPTN